MVAPLSIGQTAPMNQPSTRDTTPATDDRLERARVLLENSAQTPTLAALARQVGLSPAWLQRSFRRRYGVSPAEYARARRFDAFKRALRAGHGVTDAVYAAGFGSGSRVYERSDSLLGMPPSRYRDGGARTSIRYTTMASPLGRVLVGVTERGLCAVNLGGSDTQLLAALRDEFPHAEVTRVDAGRDEWLGAVIARIARQFDPNASTKAGADLPPLDVTASAFQWRVWQALTRIPAGETRTYGDIAREIGEPGAARAVGHACGANQLALIVPCHRVICADGSPGGWRWGAARKQKLLARERRENR